MGLYLESYKVTPKRNYLGAYAYLVVRYLDRLGPVIGLVGIPLLHDALHMPLRDRRDQP